MQDVVAGNGVVVVLSPHSQAYAYRLDTNTVLARFSPDLYLCSGFYNLARREMLLCSSVTHASASTLSCFVYDGTRHTQSDVDKTLPTLPIGRPQRLCFLDLVGILLTGRSLADGEECVAYSLQTHYTRMYTFTLPQLGCQVQACVGTLAVLCDDTMQIRDAATGSHITVSTSSTTQLICLSMLIVDTQDPRRTCGWSSISHWAPCAWH